MARKILIIICFALLAGCSNNSSELKDLRDSVDELQNTVADLTEKVENYENLDYENKYRDGVYECDLQSAGTLEFKFLASTVVHVSGDDEDGIRTFDNYYVYKFIDQNNLEMVDDLDLEGAIENNSYESLTEGKQNFDNVKFYHLRLLDGGKKLEFSPFDGVITCTYIAD